MVKYFCDVCGKEIVSYLERHITIEAHFEGIEGGEHDTHYMLVCNKCNKEMWKKFHDFLNENKLKT